MGKQENISTKVTALKSGLWGCRVFYKNQLVCEQRVTSREHIGRAFKDMMRILDKLGYDSKLAHCCRFRKSSHFLQGKTIWYRR